MGHFPDPNLPRTNNYATQPHKPFSFIHSAGWTHEITCDLLCRNVGFSPYVVQRPLSDPLINYIHFVRNKLQMRYEPQVARDLQFQGVFPTGALMGKHRLMTELAASLLKRGYSIRFRVAGWSMKPLLTSGCLLRVAPLEQPPQVGEIVLCRAKGDRLVSHRVVATSSQSIWTKGDSCFQMDGVVGRQQILGRVVAVEKPMYIPLTGRLARWTGMFLGRSYLKLVKLKMNVRRLFGVSPLEGKA